MQQLRRHDLLVLTPEGRKRLSELLRASAETSGEQMSEMFNDSRIPAIVRRHSPCDQAGIGVGLSFPIREGDRRLRFAASVTPAEIKAVISPYVLADGAFETSVLTLRVLRKIMDLGLMQPGNLGVFGATALQMVTGMRYLHDRSDLDLIVRRESIDSLSHLNNALLGLEREMGLKIDAEVVLGDVGEAKLTELLSQQKTVLVKSLLSVDLLTISSAMSSLISTRMKRVANKMKEGERHDR
jgi:phosphoribosyl-dephospho-CoA transferase